MRYYWGEAGTLALAWALVYTKEKETLFVNTSQFFFCL